MKLKSLLRKLRGDDRGTTFIEVMATVTMISVAVVGTTYSMFVAQSTLREDMHRQQVLRMVQEELEYWVGRMYMGSTESLSIQEMLGSQGRPYRTRELDPKGVEPIEVRFYYDRPMEGSTVYQPDPTSPDVYPGYYIMTVWAEWNEPGGKQHRRSFGNEVSLSTYVVPGGIGG